MVSLYHDVALMRMFGECTEAYTPVVKTNSGIEVNFMTLPNLVFVFNRGLGFPLQIFIHTFVMF